MKAVESELELSGRALQRRLTGECTNFLLIEQYGGADGELSDALRYLSQRNTIPDKVVGLLKDIETEEFAHLEMIATMVYKLTKDATVEQMEAAGLGRTTVTVTRRCITIMRQAYPGWLLTYRPMAIRSPTCMYEDITGGESARDVSMDHRPDG